MSWTRRLRIKFGTYKLNREQKALKVQRKFINYADAKKIGVLIDATQESDLPVFKEFIDKLKQSKKKVTVLCFWNKKDIPDNPLLKLGYDYFTKSDVSFLLIPRHPLVDNFTKEEFDILINLNTNHCFPLQYIAGKSWAKFRVGKYDPDNAHYCDFMLNMNNDSSFKSYFEQLHHYLNIINYNKTNE